MEKYEFDESYYLKHYPDVADAVRNGQFISGLDHYEKYGRHEGRVVSEVNKNSIEVDSVVQNYSQHFMLGDHYENQDKAKIFYVNVEGVPSIFRPDMNIEYPEKNSLPFEKYFYKKYYELKPETFRTYLPIFWTAYYVNAKYGTDEGAMNKLQEFIDKLDKTKKYFSFCQYDDGILNDVSGIDLLVYASGSNRPEYYPAPLLCYPTNAQPFEMAEKDILFSFIGADTHTIRRQLVNQFPDKCSFLPVSHDIYIDKLKKSIFAICPRGYGITSFRMFEAMSYGCIPIYVSDQFWEPFNIPFTQYGIKIRPEQIKDIPSICSQGAGYISQMQKKVEYYYTNYFVYSKAFDAIIKTLQ